MSESMSAMREKFAAPLPEAVRRQKEEVEALMRGGQPTPEGAPPPTAGGQEGAGPGAQLPVGAEGSGVQPTSDGAQQAASSAPTPGTGDPREAPKDEPKGSDSKDDAESLKRQLREAEQEARTWKGRHAKTAEEQRALAAKIADLEARLEDAAHAPEPELKEVSADEVEAYGQDLLEVAKRYVMPAARAEFERAMAPILKRLDALENGVGRVEAKEAKSEWDSFLEKLDTRLPTWREVDSSEAFMRWLDQEDEVFGEPNRKALENAAGSRNVERAAKVYERYLDQTGKGAGRSRGTKAAGTPAAGTETPQGGTQGGTAQPAQEDTRPTLEDLAAPGRPGSSQPAPMAVQPGARIWTQADITAYYRARQQRSHPHYSDRAAAAAMDAEIANAQREGRVREA